MAGINIIFSPEKCFLPWDHGCIHISFLNTDHLHNRRSSSQILFQASSRIFTEETHISLTLCLIYPENTPPKENI